MEIKRTEFLQNCVCNNQSEAMFAGPRAGNSHVGICGGLTLQSQAKERELNKLPILGL